MSEPKRYDPDFRWCCMDERSDGDYVEYEDYAILAADLARLTAELERSKRECEGLRAVATQYAASLGFVEPDEKLAKDLAALSQGEKE